jgi:predicted ferric reductase
MLHVPHLWPYFLAVALLMFVDRSYDFFFLTLHSTLASSRPCSNGSTFVSIPYSQQAGNAGCYYRVKIPEISLLEWHPFSLASSESSHHLTFFVASSGDW